MHHAPQCFTGEASDKRFAYDINPQCLWLVKAFPDQSQVACKRSHACLGATAVASDSGDEGDAHLEWLRS